MKIYLAGKMRGLPNFGADLFRRGAALLRAEGHEVFNPVEETEKLYGDHVYRDNPEGDEALAGVDGRAVFFNDVQFICKHADAVALLPNWKDSKGATAERALAEALGLQVIELWLAEQRPAPISDGYLNPPQSNIATVAPPQSRSEPASAAPCPAGGPPRDAGSNLSIGEGT